LNRREFIHELTRAGCHLYRHGSRHDIYLNPHNGRKVPVPRHSEIRNSLCTLIRRQLGLEEGPH
jgi:predicted RNA binding protein YcfA (HicA-like mRNA interferase family)